jgi:hypothetical protein
MLAPTRSVKVVRNHPFHRDNSLGIPIFAGLVAEFVRTLCAFPLCTLAQSSRLSITARETVTNFPRINGRKLSPFNAASEPRVRDPPYGLLSTSIHR